MANGIRTDDPVDSIKDIVRSSVKVPEFRQTPEEGRRIYRAKRCENKDEDNSLKTLNDKNQTSSQKFRQLISTVVGYLVPDLYIIYDL